jgi:hypothetical protein
MPAVYNARSLRVWRQRHSTGTNALHTAGTGLLAGVAVGAVVGLLGTGEDGFFTPGQAALIGGTMLGALGLVVGGVAGAAHGPVGDWQPAPAPSPATRTQSFRGPHASPRFSF